MLRVFLLCVSWLWAGSGWAQTLPAPEVGISIVRTARAEVVEALLVPGGSVTRTRPSNFSAFLIKHGNQYFLFDSGLGRSVDVQYQQGMPLWWRPFFNYEHPVSPALDQLRAANFPTIERIVLSHTHWDHASGVQDFPEAKVLVAAPELALVRAPRQGPGGTWASQVGHPTIQWGAIAFSSGPFQGYEQSFDMFGDGRVVLVPMPGHTPGSVGLFVTVDSGRQYFLIGDVAWTREAVQQGTAKFWVAGKLVDRDAGQTAQAVAKVQGILWAQPELVVLPAHDGRVQDALGYFPNWVP